MLRQLGQRRESAEREGNREHHDVVPGLHVPGTSVPGLHVPVVPVDLTGTGTVRYGMI